MRERRVGKETRKEGKRFEVDTHVHVHSKIKFQSGL